MYTNKYEIHMYFFILLSFLKVYMSYRVYSHLVTYHCSQSLVKGVHCV